ncbi:MAG: hypothetical protein P1U34_05175 [Coxiellaceae bacterium]|nr:hypothetical protein [Coxiellaceae bacterium]
MRQDTDEELAAYTNQLIEREVEKARKQLDAFNIAEINQTITSSILRTNGQNITLSNRCLKQENITRITSILSSPEACLRLLDFHKVDLGTHGLAQLMDAISVNLSLSQLSINACGITENDTQTICNMLKQNTTLMKLDLSDNSLESSAIELFKAIADNPNSSLRLLNLTRTDIRGDRDTGSDWDAIFDIYNEHRLTVRVVVHPENYQQQFDHAQRTNIKKRDHEAYVAQSMALLQRNPTHKVTAISKASLKVLTHTLSFIAPTKAGSEQKPADSVLHKVKESVNSIRHSPQKQKQIKLFKSIQASDIDTARELLTEGVSPDVAMNHLGQTARGLMQRYRGNSRARQQTIPEDNETKSDPRPR